METLRRELGEINRHSNSLANELEQTVKKLDDDKKRDEVKRDLNILKGKLEGMAGSYDPDPEAADPTDPNVTGKSRSDEKKSIHDAPGHTGGSQDASLLNNKTTFTGVHGSTPPPPHVEPTPPNTFPPPPPAASNPFEKK